MGFIREKKIYCGDRYLEVDIIPCYEKRNSGGTRSKKIKESLLSQKNINAKNARRKLLQVMETNFDERDLHVTLTYNNKYLPKTLEEANREVTNFIRRLKRKREKEKLDDLKYILVTEHTSKDRSSEEEITRIHHHLVINGGLDRDDIEALWAKGRGKNKGSMGFANADRLQADSNSGFAALSQYLTKKPANKRSWTCSQNLKRPESRTNDYKYSRRKVQNAVGHNKDLSFWERQYPGWYIADKDNGYEEVYNEMTGWSIYLKLRRRL